MVIRRWRSLQSWFVLGFLLVAFLLTPHSLILNPAYGLADHLVVSEVRVDCVGAESAEEFVEIYNPRGETAAIGGWDIAYKTATGASFSSVATIPAGRIIKPYGFFLVGGDSISPTPDVVDTSLGFAATAGHIALRNNSNLIIDKVGYGTTADSAEGGAPTKAPPKGKSSERKPGATDTTHGNGQDSDSNAADFDTRTVVDPQNGNTQETPVFNLGTIDIAATSLKLGQTSHVTVVDADRNNKPTVAETFSITVVSGADAVGILVTVQEQGANSSTFQTVNPIQPVVGQASQASTGKIKVKAVGDVITAKYADPAPFQTVSDTASFAALTTIKINEVVYDPGGTDQGKEWVELYNAGSDTPDISGWTITDEDAATVITLPGGGISVPPGAFVVVYVDSDGASDTNFSDNRANIFSGTATTVDLTNTEDQVSLYASGARDATTIVDFVAYVGDGVYNSAEDDDIAVAAGIWPSNAFVNTSSYTEGSALALKPDGDDANQVIDWVEDKSPTQGFSNTVPTPPSKPTNLSAIAGNNRVNLSWTASTPDDLPLVGYDIFRKLSNAPTYPSTPVNDTPVAATEYEDTGVTNGTTYKYIVKAVDGGGNRSDSSNEVQATPSAPLPPGNHVVVNEIMYDPTGTEPDNEWVELYNPTDTLVRMDSWVLTDGEGVYTMLANTQIAAKGYLTFGRTAGAAGGQIDYVYGGLSSGNLSLGNTSDNVIIKDTGSVIVDEVDYQSAWGGQEPKSLSRKYAGLDSNDFTNWAKSKASGGTPRAVNDMDTVGPVITHTPITTALKNRDIGIHAVIDDVIDKQLAIGASKVFYITRDASAYTLVTMSRVSDVNFDGIIPSSATGGDTIAYYIETIDFDNNVTRSAGPANPYNVTLTTTTFKVVINELMYDPADTEPANEWVELYNADTVNQVNLVGWKFGDGEAEFTFDTKLIPANGFLVLGKTASAAGGLVDVVYDTLAPGIQFSNVLANISDQAILKNPSGVIIDELNYSSEWGANNISGPNNTTLERVDPNPLLSNQQSNWLPSEQQGGSPKAQNGPHYIRNLTITPDQFNPTLGETTTIAFSQTVSGTTTVKILDENNNTVKILFNAVHKFSDTHSIVWDGKNAADTWVLQVNKVEVTVIDDTLQRTSLHKINDVTLLGENFIANDPNNAFFYEAKDIFTFFIKPVKFTLHITDRESGDTLRTIVADYPLGSGSRTFAWDGRDENGKIFNASIGTSFQTQDIVGNTLITRAPLSIEGLRITPRVSFDPSKAETTSIQYGLSVTSTVTVRIRAAQGSIVRVLVNSLTQFEGQQNISWDGRDDASATVSDGFYIVEIYSRSGVQATKEFREIVVRKVGL